MKFKVSFFALMLLISLIISDRYYVFIPIFAAFLHELGHIFASKILGIRLDSMNIGIFGARLSLCETLCSYRDEIIICFAGPFVNLICAVITYILIKSGLHNDFLEIFLFSSLSLGIINLLPVKTFDGGRILKAFISEHFSIFSAQITLSVSSFIFLFILWCTSVYLILRTSSSLSLFIFSVSVFTDIFLT